MRSLGLQRSSALAPLRRQPSASLRFFPAGCTPQCTSLVTAQRPYTPSQSRYQQRRHREAAAAYAPSAAPPVSAPTAGTAPGGLTTLGTLQWYVERCDYAGAAATFEHRFQPARQHFVRDYCDGFAADARDVAVLLMRVYTNLGRIEKVREVLAVALRDFAAARAEDGDTPARYARLGKARYDADSRRGGRGVEGGDGRRGGWGEALRLETDPLALPAAAAPSPSPPTAAATAQVEYDTPSLLNVSVFNAYLEALTRRNKYAVEEVTFVLDLMKEHGVERDALTYHYLVELHVRAGYDPTGLWTEMTQQVEPALVPLPATVQTFLLRVVPHSSDPAFVVEVTRAALRHGTAVVDKRMLAELMVQWLKPVRATAPSDGGDGGKSTAAASLQYPPEYVLWLMLELELRCVLEKASFTQYVQRQYFAELLLRCAKCTDAATAEQVFALMDRHAVPKTAEVLALVVWCWSQALEVERALDLVEWMALKGYLDQADCFRKAQFESLRYSMDRHYLMTFADSINTPALVERALAHLQARRHRGDLVTVHTLDLVLLALARIGEERQALQLVSAYETRWGVVPRTNTYNALLTGCAGHRSTMLHRVIYRTMRQSGVAPNVLTFRILIRQAVTTGSMDEAIFYLEEVTAIPGLRVEVEMILPILERAARVGDVETANRIGQYSLTCDIGIDGTVLRSVMQQLTEAGQSVEVLKGQLPLHEALRSRSKAGRQRARNEVLV